MWSLSNTTARQPCGDVPWLFTAAIELMGAELDSLRSGFPQPGAGLQAKTWAPDSQKPQHACQGGKGLEARTAIARWRRQTRRL